MGVVSVLIVVLAVSVASSLPHDRKPGLLSFLDDGLTRLMTTKCQGSDATAAWNQYCDDITPVARACPANESSKFYQRHCSADLVIRQIKDLPLRIFESQDTAVQAVQEIVAGVPTEPCGYNLSEFCRRDTAVCDKSINRAGVCQSAEDLCSREVYRERCLRTAHVYLVHRILIAYFNETGWPAVLNGSEQRQEQEELNVGPTEYDSSGRNTRWIVEMLCAGGVLVVAAIVAGIIFRYRKARETREIHYENSDRRGFRDHPKQRRGRSYSAGGPTSPLSNDGIHRLPGLSVEESKRKLRALDPVSDKLSLCNHFDGMNSSEENPSSPSSRGSQSDWTQELDDQDYIEFSPASTGRLSFSNS